MPTSGNDMTGAASWVDATFRFVDARGDKTAVSIRLTPAQAVVANVAGLRTALGAATNALLYEVQMTNVYAGLPSANAATDAVFSNTDSVVNILMKNIVTLEGVPFEIPAPIGAMVIGGETVDISNAEYVGVTDALEILLGALAYEPYTTRFTERRNINKAIPAKLP